MITFIESIDEIQKEGNVAVIIKNGDRSPCKKIINTVNSITDRMTDFKFYCIEFKQEMTEEFGIGGLPCIMKVVNGNYGRKLCGHFWGEFEIESFLLEK